MSKMGIVLRVTVLVLAAFIDIKLIVSGFNGFSLFGILAFGIWTGIGAAIIVNWKLAYMRYTKEQLTKDEES